MIQEPPPKGMPYTPLPGALGNFTPATWPATFKGSAALFALGVASAIIGQPTSRRRMVSAAIAAWGGYRAYQTFTVSPF